MNKPCTIMVVDDDKDDQWIFSSAIREIDSRVECRCFDNARQGLQVLQNRESGLPDCIFLDLNLPFMHGFDFLRLLKTSEDLSAIPVIIYSTSSRESDINKARELGAFTFLSKPTSFYELKDKISTLLSTGFIAGAAEPPRV